jgi:hypothetical protein
VESALTVISSNPKLSLRLQSFSLILVQIKNLERGEEGKEMESDGVESQKSGLGTNGSHL